MNAKIKFFISTLFIFTVFLITSITISVEASPATSYTMTLNSKGRYVRTQDAYLPDRSVVDLKLNKPEDIYIDANDFMFIADTGNKRILKYNINTDEVDMEITLKELKSPDGIFVTKEGDIYVADHTAKAIFRFSSDGLLKNKYEKPTAPSFEGTVFEPSKIGVDNSGNMFIYGGVYDGIIHLSNSGEFQGYFTSNRIELSLSDRVRDMFYTEKQKLNLSRNPAIFSNVFVDSKGIVYTTTTNSEMYSIKKHNIAGLNNFSSGVVSQSDATDVYVDESGIIYAAMSSGSIFVYSQSGEFIYSFGASNFRVGSEINEDISGLFTTISAVAVDSKGFVWAVDDSKSFIQSFKPTDYAEKIYSALALYTNRKYNESIKIWQEVLRLNQMSVIAHNNLGKNYMSIEEYELAMDHFLISGNRADFSEAFWEVRNIDLQQNLSYIIIILIALFVLSFILKKVDKKHPFKYKIKTYVSKIFNRKFLRDIFYMFRVMTHPLDSFYEIKKGRKGSLLGATIIYTLFFFIFLWYTIGKGFIYQFIAVEDLDLNTIVFGFFALTLLFVICNYLVTSINEGEGGIKKIFLLFAYSLAPMYVAFISITLLSHILTYNESFFLDIIKYFAFTWTGVNIFLGIQEIHNYSIRNTIKSIIITAIFMIIIVVVILIIIIMWDQLANFFIEIIMEAIRNVTK
ncbi:MAG: integral rane protein [Haloplasmataceae bacterium]|jgi:streptogramin lyase|nr:integral rane protein [Haloplasmataceae bacterium]